MKKAMLRCSSKRQAFDGKEIRPVRGHFGAGIPGGNTTDRPRVP